MNAAHASRCTVQASSRVRAKDHVKRVDRSRACPVIRRHAAHRIVSSANRSSTFAATVSPDIAQEPASSGNFTEHSSKVFTQHSSGASHIKPFYPEKTINCSDGMLRLAFTHSSCVYAALHARCALDIFQVTCQAVDAEEWKVRVDLAAIYRICHNLGFNEGINNHLTAAVPGMPGHFLVFVFGLLWSEVTASNLVLMDNKVCCAAAL